MEAHDPRNDGLFYICHHHQNVCAENCQNSKHAKDFLPKYPTFLILHSLEKEPPKRIYRRLMGKAIINVLVILIRFEPEFVRVGKEQQTENKEEDNEADRDLGEISHLTAIVMSLA